MSEFHVASRMQRHDLHKLHGLGNDFLLWFQPAVPEGASERAQRWCNRTTGIGADGLIVAINDRVAPQFVLFNADGGRAEVSGNGLRCFAHAIAGRRGVDKLETLVATDAGDRSVRITDALSETASVSVGMGAPNPGPSLEGIDLAAHLEFIRADTVDLGNPHLVIEVLDERAHDIRTVGPAIEKHFLPTGINVHLVTPTQLGVRMSIWERGAGATEACGSGACAAAAIAALSRPGQTDFVVQMPGGSASVQVGDELTLNGPSSYVAAIEPMRWA
ncbi:MAG: diaminopimelate epimerase [Acidimicrobiales bacterium]|jgi:diaminopimelate epimerase